MTTTREYVMTGLKCMYCNADSTNGTVLCKRCRTTVRMALGNVASYHADLLSLGGETLRLSRSAGSISDPTGTAVAREDSLTRERDAPDQAAAATKTMLVGWARVLVDDRPQLELPDDTVKSLAAFVAHHLPTIATLEWAGEVARESVRFEKRLRRIIERSRGLWYAGVCSAELQPERPHDERSCVCECHGSDLPCSIEAGCGREYDTIEAVYCDRDLYAQPGSTYVKCPACSSQWRVSERRHILIEAARDSLLPVPVIASAVVTLLDGEPSVRRLTERLNKWVQRGVIDDYGVRYVMGRPMRVYRLGDVLDTLAQAKSRTMT